jgi:Cdc6-like AAA superfamily ATPase
LLCLLGFVLHARLPLRDPFQETPWWNLASLLEPQEQNATARLPVVRTSLVKVALAADGRTAFVVDYNGAILRSTDAGASWSRIASGTKEVLLNIALAADGRTAVAVGTNGAILRSTDAGQSWQLQTLQHRRSPAPIVWLLWLACVVALWASLQPRPEPPPPERVAEVITSDRPLIDGNEDVAGTNALAMQISRFLRNEKTDPPLTIAVTGAWGSGKSSVLNCLCRDLQEHGLRPVSFNAWHHQKEENLFAALLQQVREQAVPPLLSLPGIIVRFRLLFFRIVKDLLPFLAELLFSCVVIVVFLWLCNFFATKLLPIQPDWLKDTLKTLQKIQAVPIAKIAISLSGIGALTAWVTWNILRSRLESLDPGKLIGNTANAMRWKDLGGQLAFRTRFAEALKEVTNALDKRRLSIIIDDLDRCKPDQLAEIMEAINFLTNTGNCFVILAIDRKQVLNGIGLAYAAMAKEDAPEGMDEHKARTHYAENFLRKLIQMEIPVPLFDADAAHKLIANAKQNKKHKASFSDLARRFALAVLLATVSVYGTNMLLSRQRPAPNPLPSTAAHAVSGGTQTTLKSAPKTARLGTPAPNHPSPNQDLDFEPGREAPAMTVWYWAALTLSICLIVGLCLWLLYPSSIVVVDSREFKDALLAWTPAAFETLPQPSPREFKRFLNHLRFVASKEQPKEEQSGEQGEGEPSKAVPWEPTLVGLSVLAGLDPQLVHDLAKNDTNPIPTITDYQTQCTDGQRKAVYTAVLVTANSTGFKPTKDDAERFSKVWMWPQGIQS